MPRGFTSPVLLKKIQAHFDTCRSALARDDGMPVTADVPDTPSSRASALLQLGHTGDADHQSAINPAFENKLYHSPRSTLLLRSEIKDCSCVPAP
jgi:hypothetical protein